MTSKPEEEIIFILMMDTSAARSLAVRRGYWMVEAHWWRTTVTSTTSRGERTSGTTSASTNLTDIGDICTKPFGPGSPRAASITLLAELCGLGQWRRTTWTRAPWYDEVNEDQSDHEDHEVW